jgi:hypothetical protein
MDLWNKAGIRGPRIQVSSCLQPLQGEIPEKRLNAPHRTAVNTDFMLNQPGQEVLSCHLLFQQLKPDLSAITIHCMKNPALTD